MDRGTGRTSETRRRAETAAEAKAKVEVESEAEARRERIERERFGAEEGAHRMQGKKNRCKMQKLKNKNEDETGIEIENEVREDGEEKNNLDEQIRAHELKQKEVVHEPRKNE
jgi:hypothetical protein